MGYTICHSETPLAFDALGAIKVTHWPAAAPSEKIYTLGKLYVQSGTLHAELSAFEREPNTESLISLALAGETGVLVLSFGVATAGLALRSTAPSPLVGAAGTSLPMPPFGRIAGQDEQGWFWGTRFALPQPVLQQAGCILQPGSIFHGALYKHTAGGGPFGASCQPPNMQTPVDASSFTPFEVVSC